MTGDPLTKFRGLGHQKATLASETPVGVLVLQSVSLAGVLLLELSEAPPGGLRNRGSEIPDEVQKGVRASVMRHAQLVLLLTKLRLLHS